MAGNQVYQQLKALEVNKTSNNFNISASRNEVGNTLTGTTKTYSTLDAQGVESVNSVQEWSRANDNAKEYFQSVVSGEAPGNFATQQGRVRNLIGNGFGLDSPVVDSNLFKAFDVGEAVSAGYDKTYEFSTGVGNRTSASDLVFDKTLINSERSSITSKGEAESIMASVNSTSIPSGVIDKTNDTSNQVAFNADDKVINFSLDDYGTTGQTDEAIVNIPIPAIPAEDGYLQEADLSGDDVPGFFHQDDSDPFFTNEVFVPAAFDGTEATAIEAYKLAEAANAGKNFLKESFTVTKPEITTESQDIISDAAAAVAMAQLNGASALEIAALEGQLTSLTQNLDPKTAEYLQNHNGRNSLEEYEYQADIKAAALAKEKAVKIAEDKAVQLARIQENLNPIIEQVEENKGVNVDAKGDPVGVNDPAQVELMEIERAEEERLAELSSQPNVDDEQGFLADKIATEKEDDERTFSKYSGKTLGQATDELKKSQIMKNAREKSKAEAIRIYGDSARGDMQRSSFKSGQELIGGKDPFAFSTFAYPPGVTNSKENGHYILFYVNVQNKTKYSYDGIGEDGIISVGDEYQTTKPKDTSGPAGGAALPTLFHSPKGAKEMGYADDVAYKKQQLANGASGSILYNNQTFLSKNRKSKIPGVSQVFGATTTRITDSVALYLPPGVKSNLDAQYDDSKTGMFGFLAFSGKDLLNAMNDHDFDAATNEAFKTTGTILEEAGKKMAASVVSAVTGAEGVQATFDKAFGRTLNPYIEVTFGSMGMRTFDYTFKFSPKSEYETQEAKAIIQLFRFHMAPELIAGQETHNRYLTLPSTFDIHYMYQSGVGDVAMAKENDFYNKIATCVLTSVNVDYTPNGEIQSFADGAPVQMTLALSFKETEMMTKDKINDGF